MGLHILQLDLGPLDFVVPGSFPGDKLPGSILGWIHLHRCEQRFNVYQIKKAVSIDIARVSNHTNIQVVEEGTVYFIRIYKLIV